MLLRLASGLAASGRAARTGELRLLIVRPDHIGDLVFMSPALQELRSALPEAHLTLSLGPWATGVGELLAQVDRLDVQTFPGFQRGPKPPVTAPYAQAARLSAHWTGRYDACLIARPDHWWGAMTAAFAGIPTRYGWSTPEIRPFLTSYRRLERGLHEVATNLALVRHFLGELGHQTPVGTVSPGHPPLALTVPPSAAERAQAWLTRVLGPDTDYLCVHPGAGAPTKLWPEAHYHTLVRELHRHTGLPVIITGSLQEADLAETVAAASLGAIPTAGEFTVPELAWILGRARVCVGSDSGPLHLAAALGGRTVHVFGPADEAKFGPWSPPSCHRVLTADLPCRPCGDLSRCREDPPLACLAEVSAEEVLVAALDLARR